MISIFWGAEMDGEIFLDIKSMKICCKVNGCDKEDVPVIMVHGLGGSSSDFARAAEFSGINGRTLVIPDLPGFGQSCKPFDFSYDLMEQALLLSELIDKLGFLRADIVAHSMGGVIAILLAKSFPEKVNRLITAEPNLKPENAKISATIKSFGNEEDFAGNFDMFIEKFNKPASPSALRFYSTLKQCAYYSLYRSAVSLIRHSHPPLYADFLGLNVRRHFIRGEKSAHDITAGMLEDFRESGIGFHMIPDAGHGMMGDNPEAFYAAVARILNE